MMEVEPAAGPSHSRQDLAEPTHHAVGIQLMKFNYLKQTLLTGNLNKTHSTSILVRFIIICSFVIRSSHKAITSSVF